MKHPVSCDLLLKETKVREYLPTNYCSIKISPVQMKLSFSPSQFTKKSKKLSKYLEACFHNYLTRPLTCNLKTTHLWLETAHKCLFQRIVFRGLLLSLHNRFDCLSTRPLTTEYDLMGLRIINTPMWKLGSFSWC